jgi:hypothetical protein
MDDCESHSDVIEKKSRAEVCSGYTIWCDRADECVFIHFLSPHCPSLKQQRERSPGHDHIKLGTEF